MKSNLTRRNAIRSTLGAIASAAVAGCASQQQPSTPTTQPTTHPSGEQQAYGFASGLWQNLIAVALIVEAVPGLVPPADVPLINLAIAEGTKALATWQANLGQPSAVTFQAEFYAMLPDLARIVANANAVRAGTTVAAIRAKKLHR